MTYEQNEFYCHFIVEKKNGLFSLWMSPRGGTHSIPSKVRSDQWLRVVRTVNILHDHKMIELERPTMGQLFD